MVKHECPHCGEKSISGYRRMFLGPALPTTCSECEKSVGVPYGKSLLSMGPFLASILLLKLTFDNGFLSYWLGVFGTMTTAVLWASIVPLEKR